MKFKIELGPYVRSKTPLNLKLLKRTHFAIPTTQMKEQSASAKQRRS